MNTPSILSTPATARSLNGRVASDLVQQVSEERMLMMVGQADLSALEGFVTCKLIGAADAASAQRVIMELLNVRRTVPSVIIIQFHQQVESDFKKWKRFFESHPILRSIPFFLLSDNVDAALKAMVKQYTFVDEIMTLDCIKHNLFGKVDFVKRIKRMKGLPELPKTTVRYKGNYLNNFLKRTLDIAAATIGLVIASPVMLIIAAAIRAESKGPVFYASLRAGRNYKVFKFYKFRTMVPDADKQLDKLKHMNQYDTGNNNGGPVFIKVSNDPRVTRLGNFLRNSSLDELPQLLNVLKGDMSLVGNRPLPLYEATTLTTDEWVERFLAPAGITGLWQITKRGKKEMSVEERIELDINYACKNSFTYDMWLMVNTPFALIQKDNV